MVVSKKCELELLYLLPELSNIQLEKFCFLDCWKVLLMVHVFKNVGERSTAKSYYPVDIYSMVSKVFEKLVNNTIVDHLVKYGLFLFQVWF